MRHDPAESDRPRRCARSLSLAAALAATLLFAAPPAPAITIYTYTGNPFTDFSPGTNPYTTSDYVHGWFTTAAPLAANLSAYDITGVVLSWEFNDFADDHLPITSGPPASFYLTDTNVSTDGSGNITTWKIGVTDGYQTHYISTFATNGFASDLDNGALNAQAGPLAWNINSPGIWTITPEPSALLLLGSGILGLAIAGTPRRV